MQPFALLIEAENALYPYTPSHAAGMTAAHSFSALSPADFQAAYTRARETAKKRLGQRLRDRLLYFQIMVEQTTPTADPQRILDYHNAYWEAYLAAIKPLPEAQATLQALTNAGVRIAFVSNLPTDLALREALTLTQHGITPHAIVTPAEVGSPLPASDLLYHALLKLGLTEDEIWAAGLAQQALVLAARTEDIAVVQIDAEQPQQISDRIYAVRGWGGLLSLYHSLRPQTP